ncbi:putative exonuclease -like protein [Babesia sp. Xinjiang]|uniref:putative exonuclease -like protein n=1 Tax=Babesia sp. Xinjiang TaxID=462227 RepID=UPI000A21F6D0|nr:putative exonuclease -like protein [Babesia sp. Xinjiang]ORM40154.1 putative exonuclease -like protein [Babesia sp. Xinjiang]
MEEKEKKDPSIWPSNCTHISRWLLRSVSHLKELQEHTFYAALERIKASTKVDEKELPTLDEELWLIRFYALQLSRFVAAQHLKDAVKETSLTFFNRFYIRRSMLEHDPRLVMFTCITLAIKSEDMWRNYYVDKLLGPVEGLNISRVFELEATVCDALGFNFLVLHTSDSMHVLRSRCIEYIKESLGIDDEILGEHLGVVLSMCTDAEKDSVLMHENPELIFLYTPTQLTAANFVRHCKKRLGTLISVDKFLVKKLLHDQESQLSVLTKAIEKINNIMAKHMELRSSMEAQQEKAGECPACLTYVNVKMAESTDGGTAAGYTLQPLLQHRSSALDWKQLQCFITWLMCQPSRTKCPLTLRHKRNKAHNNVIIAVPYLDADYLMDDLDALKAVIMSSEGSTLCRLKTPKTHDDNSQCAIIKKLIFMDVKQSASHAMPCSIAQFTLNNVDLSKLENWHFAFTEEYRNVSDTPSAVSNVVGPDISEDKLFEVLMANCSAPRRLCKTTEQLWADLDRYFATQFTEVPESKSSDTTAEESVSDGDLKTDAFVLGEALLRRYASVAHTLSRDPIFTKTFAIDCEMVTAGTRTALARITIVDTLFRVVCDVMVRPEEPVTDYRTPYSGITEESLEGVTVTLADIQECLNRLLDKDTLLVGHSLENDLKACEIKHLYVLDTAVQYTPPKRFNKPSLKSLAKMHLQLELIRENGHDSYTDAVTTMYLAMEGVTKLEPPITYVVDILGPHAYSLMVQSDDPYPAPKIHIFDPMGKEYESLMDVTVSVEPTSDDASSVERLGDVLRENKNTESTCFHIVVLRDFQKLCSRKLFESQKTDELKSLIKRVNPKAVCAYLSRLAGNLEKIISYLDHDDVVVMSNLSGDATKVDILSLAIHSNTLNRSRKLLRLLLRLFAFGNDQEGLDDIDVDQRDQIPTEVSDFYRRSQGIMLAELRREHEVAVRDRSNSWVVFLSKQISNKRGNTTQALPVAKR